MTTPEPQVAWTAIEQGAAVVTADGAEVASVLEVAGDRDADIFSSLVVKGGTLESKRSLPAERVTAIWPRRVETDLSAEEVGALPRFEEPVVERLEPKEGFFSRLRARF